MRLLGLMALAVVVVACSSSDDASGSSSSGGGSSSGAVPPGGSPPPGSVPRGGDGGTTPPPPTAPGAGSGGTGGAIGASVDLPGCSMCKVHVPSGYKPGSPTPLVVALHGDEGPAVGVPNIIQLWSGAADAQTVLVLALPCGTELGCADGNWSNWLAGQGYQLTQAHMDWINAQATKMESLYDVDVKREYVAGYSGGAYVLGYFAQANADRYAGSAFVAGGMPAWTGTGHPCPTRKIPGYFLGGDADPRTGGQMSDTATSFKNCTEEIELDLVTGADHQATIDSLGTGRAAAILTWLDARPLP